MKRTTELVAEPGDRVEVRDPENRTSTWFSGEIRTIIWNAGEPPAYAVKTDLGPTLYVSSFDIRKPA